MSDLTWPALLAHWTAFAQSSLALPRTAEGERWRRSVPAIIGLQAITFALADLDRLAPGEDRAAAQDLAAVGIRTHAQTLRDLWRDEPPHAEIERLIDDARAALAAARDGGWEWRITSEHLVTDHPAALVEDLLAGGFDGDLYVPVPGAALFRGSPAAFVRGRYGALPPRGVLDRVRAFLGAGEVGDAQRVPSMRQVYRQFDFGLGRAVRDLVRPAAEEAPPGQPQLVPAIVAGVAQNVTLPIRGMSDQPALPVVEDAD